MRSRQSPPLPLSVESGTRCFAHYTVSASGSDLSLENILCRSLTVLSSDGSEEQMNGISMLMAALQPSTSNLGSAGMLFGGNSQAALSKAVMQQSKGAFGVSLLKQLVALATRPLPKACAQAAEAVAKSAPAGGQAAAFARKLPSDAYSAIKMSSKACTVATFLMNCMSKPLPVAAIQACHPSQLRYRC